MDKRVEPIVTILIISIMILIAGGIRYVIYTHAFQTPRTDPKTGNTCGDIYYKDAHYSFAGGPDEILTDLNGNLLILPDNIPFGSYLAITCWPNGVVTVLDNPIPDVQCMGWTAATQDYDGSGKCEDGRGNVLYTWKAKPFSPIQMPPHIDAIHH